MSRLNNISIEKDFNKTVIKFEEFKMFSLKNTGDYYTCIHAEDISNYKLFVKSILVETLDKNKDNIKETTLTLLDTITVYWSTNIHIKLLLLFRDMKEFICGIQEELELTIVEKKEERHVDNLNILGKFDCHIEINQEHNAKISFGKSSKKQILNIDYQNIKTLIVASLKPCCRIQRCQNTKHLKAYAYKKNLVVA